MNIELIANTDSGGGTDRAALAESLRAHGATLTDDGPDRLVAAGGDGTVGAAADRARELGIPLAVIPTGTANDFARAHDLPADLDAAIALAATGTVTRSLELGYVGDRPFVNVAATGLAPQAARRAVPFKRILGPAAYVAGALIAAVRDRPVRCVADADGDRVFAGDVWQLMVACSGAFGGGSSIEPADPEDGRLDLVIVPALSRLHLPRHGAALRSGTITDHADTLHRRARTIVVEVAARTPFNVDGEVVKLGGAVSFTVHRDAVQLVTG